MRNFFPDVTGTYVESPSLVDDSRYPERIDPDVARGGPLAAHMKRYEFAREFCVGRRVLDAGCGMGYGAPVLSRVAECVIGFDRSMAAIGSARSRYARESVGFAVAELAAVPAPDDSFDVVCAFEVIEHLQHPREVLGEFARLVRNDGHVLLSTPHVERTDLDPENPHHVVEYAADDLLILLEQFFEKVELFGQHRKQSAAHRWVNRLDVLGIRTKIPRSLGRRIARSLGSEAWPDVGSEDLYIDELTPRARQTIAVCRRPIGRNPQA